MHATDVSNASRTMLMDIKTLKQSKELCQLFDIPISILPQIHECSDDYGITEDGIPIRG